MIVESKPCEKRTKKELVDTACKERGLRTGLSKFKKAGLIALCCNPDGPERYLRGEWEKLYSVSENSLVADILSSMNKDMVKELLQQEPEVPSRALWNRLTDQFNLTRGNIFGNPVKCDVPVPAPVKEATLLSTSGKDVYEHKDEIKNKLGGVYHPQMQSAWTWHLDKCEELASMFEKHGILMGDVTIEPCTAMIYYPVKIEHRAIRELDPKPMRGMFARKREMTDEEGVERAKAYKQDVADLFDLDAGSVTRETVRSLISNPETSKFFHEEFGAPPSWRCIEPGKAKEMLDNKETRIIDRDAVAFDDDDISPSYLKKQRDILPRVMASSSPY
jgi:hypothetical protein